MRRTTKKNAVAPSRSQRAGSFRSVGASVGVSDIGGIQRVKQIAKGLPFNSLEQFGMHANLPMSAVAELVNIPPSTLHRRKASKRLAPDESERLFRFAQLFEKATELFEGNRAAAMQWLRSPN